MGFDVPSQPILVFHNIMDYNVFEAGVTCPLHKAFCFFCAFLPAKEEAELQKPFPMKCETERCYTTFFTGTGFSLAGSGPGC